MGLRDGLIRTPPRPLHPGHDRRGDGRRIGAILAALSLLVVTGACGNGPAATPDGGNDSWDAEAGQPDGDDLPTDAVDVPPGHVVFALSFRKAPPRDPGVDVLREAYLQEVDVRWLDETGARDSATYREWVAVVEPVRSGLASKAYLCLCDRCGACRNPTEADGTLSSSARVVALRDAEEIAYEWDGTLWSRGTCPDGAECVSVAAATPGRYAVEFDWGLACREVPPYRTSCDILQPPYGSSGPIYFDYPETTVVRYTIDCSGVTDYADPGEPCL